MTSTNKYNFIKIGDILSFELLNNKINIEVLSIKNSEIEILIKNTSINVNLDGTIIGFSLESINSKDILFNRIEEILYHEQILLLDKKEIDIINKLNTKNQNTKISEKIEDLNLNFSNTKFEKIIFDITDNNGDDTSNIKNDIEVLQFLNNSECLDLSQLYEVKTKLKSISTSTFLQLLKLFNYDSGNNIRFLNFNEKIINNINSKYEINLKIDDKDFYSYNLFLELIKNTIYYYKNENTFQKNVSLKHLELFFS